MGTGSTTRKVAPMREIIYQVYCKHYLDYLLSDDDLISRRYLDIGALGMLTRSIRLCSRTIDAPYSRAKLVNLRGLSHYPRNESIIMGAVSYCDAVSGIWEGMKQHFVSSGFKFDFVLFTSYERQVESLLTGNIDIAWNGPLAHVRTQRLASSIGRRAISLGMRDVDQDFVTYIVTRKDAGIESVKDLAHKRLAVGTYDSPQAYIIPMHHLRTEKVNLSTVSVTRFDKDIGKHGDTAMGEVGVIEAIRNGDADAGFVSKLMFDRRDISHPNEAHLSENLINVPVFDHCQFDALDTLSTAKQVAFQDALAAMDWNNEKDRKIMELEGIKQSWKPTREHGYDIVRAATEDELNVPFPPTIHTAEKHPFKTLYIVS